jgi:transposase
MDGSILLRASQRKALLRLYRHADDPALRLRAQILLLLADGWTWATITAVLYCSSRTVALWQRRFDEGGVAALTGQRRGRRPWLDPFWTALAVRWVTHFTPRDFGLLRSRWCCRVVVVLLLDLHQVRVSEETIRRWLHRHELVWRRPRPVLGPTDPQRVAKLRAIRQLLGNLPTDEVAVFQDEVDINLNPKIGSMWMRRGQQATVATPGTNQKRYLAGSLNWRSGGLIATEGTRRNSELFIRHLDDLRRHYRCYRVIHVICDNGKFHDSRAVRQYLQAQAGRIVLHFLPTYAPQANPIERVWWKLHEEITRNHRCHTLDELLDLTFAWLEQRTPLEVEDQIYFPRKKAA